MYRCEVCQTKKHDYGLSWCNECRALTYTVTRIRTTGRRCGVDTICAGNKWGDRHDATCPESATKIESALDRLGRAMERGQR